MSVGAPQNFRALFAPTKKLFVSKVGRWSKFWVANCTKNAHFLHRTPKNGMPNFGHLDFSSSEEFRAKFWWRPDLTPKKHPPHPPPTSPGFFRAVRFFQIFGDVRNCALFASNPILDHFLPSPKFSAPVDFGKRPGEGGGPGNFVF